MTTWALIAGCAVVLALPLTWRAARRRFDPFEPIVVFAVAWGVMFVARPASMLLEGETRFWGLDVRNTLARALALALLGAVAFVCGYELRVGRRIADRLPVPRSLDTRRAVLSAVILGAVAIVALVVLLPVSEGTESLRILLGGRSERLGELVEGSSTYIWYGSLLAVPASVALVALAIRERSAWLGVLAAPVVAVALVRTVPTGDRIALLPMLGGLLVLAYVMRERRPRVPVLIGIALAALVASYFLLHTRDPADRLTAGSAIERLSDRPQEVFDPILAGADSEMVLALSAALTVVPEQLSYRWGGATLGDLATRPIPREIWPEKPRPPGDTVVATVWPQFYPGLDPAFSPLLVLYWDFGFAGVALGMGLFGTASRVLYEWFRRHRRVFAAQLIFAVGVWFIAIGARNDPVDTIVLGAFLLAPVVLVSAIASSRVGRPRLRGRARA
jgi:hypothetical protein